jgi:hypothetical protein
VSVLAPNPASTLFCSEQEIVPLAKTSGVDGFALKSFPTASTTTTQVQWWVAKPMRRAPNGTARINRQLLKVRTDFERIAATAAQNGDHQFEHVCQAIMRRIDSLLQSFELALDLRSDAALLAGGVDLELVVGRGVVAAIAGIGNAAIECRTPKLGSLPISIRRKLLH